MQLEVQTTRIANWIPTIVAPPQGGRLSLAIATTKVLAPAGGHSLLGPSLRPIRTIRLDVEAASIAHVVAVHVAPP